MGSQYKVPKYKVPKKDWEALKKYIGKAKMKKLLATPSKAKFTRFHKSWSKNNVLSIWKGATWDQVLDFCYVMDIGPKEVMNWLAGRKINKTDWKTIQIANLIRSSNSKLSLRSKAISLSNKLITIDGSLKQRPEEEVKHWQERIYQRVFKALQRGSIE